jgi:SAM-dependent methyltransferase
MRGRLNRLAARAYGAGYDAVVTGFAPYERLVAEIAQLVERASGPASRVLDASCGTGSLAIRLARRGHSVVGLDAVEALVLAARHRTPLELRDRVSFHSVDLARRDPPGGEHFDVVVAPHTLYWHPEPLSFLTGCRRALAPGGHAVILAYARPPSVARTFAEIRESAGTREALRALRWLVPTALFEALRDVDRRYLAEHQFTAALRGVGFDVLDCRPTFLAGVSLLGLARVSPDAARLSRPPGDVRPRVHPAAPPGPAVSRARAGSPVP